MKRTLCLFLLCAGLCLPCVSAQAYLASTESHFANRPAESHKSDLIEGWIVKMDVSKAQIFVADASGVEKKIWLKPGEIADYKVRDKVRVHNWAGSREAKTIEKIKAS